MPQTRCVVRMTDGSKQSYDVNLTNHEEILAAFKSELPDAKVVLISVPCSKPEVELEAA